jgi:hypothetical protein
MSRRVLTALQIATFTFGSVIGIVPAAIGGLPYGWDAVVYSRAARALLEGGDPWFARGYNIEFGAPPPSVIPYLPFAFLPDPVVSSAWIVIGTVSAVYSVRRLRLPAWWLLFPPLTIGVAAGSSAPLVIALLVRGGVVADAFAVLVRIYAGIPLLLLRKWRSLVAAVVATALTAPFVGWLTFIQDREHVAEVFAKQDPDGYAATAVPVLIPLAVFGLVALGLRRSAWLIVPALWPHTQPYYASIALPVLAEVPLVAISLSLPIPGLVAFGLVGDAIMQRFSLGPGTGSDLPPDHALDRDIAVPSSP